MNNQKPLAQAKGNAGLLVHSIFDTIQGEGPFSGSPCTFIRLAGCNLQCPMCDTEYTEGAVKMSVQDILNSTTVSKWTNGRLFVLTGGEPFRQPIGPLIDELVSAGHKVQIETNGTMWQPSVYSPLVYFTSKIFIVCSPKTRKVHPALRQWIKTYKYVLRVGDICTVDGLPTSALGLGLRVVRPPENFPPDMVIVQPADEKDPEANHRNLQACVYSSLAHGYRVGVQLHKIINVP